MGISNYVERFEKLMPNFIKVFHSSDESWLEEVMDVTICQCVVLQILSQNNNCKMSDLSEEVGVTLSNMTGMLDRLEKEDLAKRVPDPDDRRINRIKLTTKGENVVKKILSRKRKNLTTILSKLTDPEKSDLLRIMEKISKGKD